MRTFMRVTLAVALAVGMVAMGLNALGALIISPLVGLVGVVFAILYAAVALSALRWSGLWARPAWGWVAASLLWGGGVATALVMAVGTPIIDLASAWGPEATVMSWGGAYPEEVSKASGVALLLLVFRQLNRPWHGLAVGCAIGLGFEVNENLLYGAAGAAAHPQSDWPGLLSTWGLRIVAGPFLHAVLTGIAGWGIGRAMFSAHLTWYRRLATALGWLAVAFALHFSWNVLPANPDLYLVQMAVTAAVAYPLFIWLALRARKLARADRSYSYSPGLASFGGPGAH